ncbi:MAG: GAF domain-containing protein [Clostridia bacterium]|nr:GAF domain-containing protein [Clostridia bacterium]
MEHGMISGHGTGTDYDALGQDLKVISEDAAHRISILSNASALIWEALEDINWCGFYLMHEGRLILGPFQGKIACTVIEPGKGVCGTAVKRNETVLVKDVHTFDGHIACDSASNSEIVVPIHRNGEIWGVLDIDSPLFARFDEKDRTGLESVARVLEELLR